MDQLTVIRHKTYNLSQISEQVLKGNISSSVQQCKVTSRSAFHHVELSLPVHSCGISMECRMPLDGQELHPADGVVIHSFLVVTVQQLERHTTEVIH